MSNQREPVITAWAGWDEWEGVYNDLFALDEPERRAAGVRHVDIWRGRGVETVPHSVDMTGAFVELELLCQAHAPRTDETGLSEYSLRMMYGCLLYTSPSPRD